MNYKAGFYLKNLAWKKRYSYGRYRINHIERPVSSGVCFPVEIETFCFPTRLTTRLITFVAC